MSVDEYSYIEYLFFERMTQQKNEALKILCVFCKKENGMSKTKERLRKLIEEHKEQTEEEPEKENPDPGVDYAELYREQTGKDLASGEYVLQ